MRERHRSLFAFRLKHLSLRASIMFRFLSCKISSNQLMRASLEYENEYSQWHYEFCYTYRVKNAHVYVLTNVSISACYQLYSRYTPSFLSTFYSRGLLFLLKSVVLTLEYHRLPRCTCAPTAQVAQLPFWYIHVNWYLSCHLPWLGTGTWMEYISWSDNDMKYSCMVHAYSDLGHTEQVSNHVGCISFTGILLAPDHAWLAGWSPDGLYTLERIEIKHFIR